MPSIDAYLESYHKLVCDEIVKAVNKLQKDGIRVYCPKQITYVYDDDYELTLLFDTRERDGLDNQ